MKRMISVLLSLLLLAALFAACGGEKTDDTQGAATLPTLIAPEGQGDPAAPDGSTPQSDPASVPNEGGDPNGQTGASEGESQKPREGNAQDGTDPWPSLEPAPSLPSSLPTPGQTTPSNPTPSQPSPSQPTPSQPSPSQSYGDTEEDVTSHSYPDTDEDLKP